MLRRKNSSMVTILIINTLLKESSNRASDGLHRAQAQPPKEEALGCEHWLQAQWRNPLVGPASLPLGLEEQWVLQCGQKANTLQETWLFTTKEPKSLSSHCCHLSSCTNQGLEQIKDDTRTGGVEGSKMVLLTVVNRLPRGPSRVRNTLVLLQGDALE